MWYTKVPDNELKMVTEEFVVRNSSLSVYNESISNLWSVTKCWWLTNKSSIDKSKNRSSLEPIVGLSIPYLQVPEKNLDCLRGM